MRSGTRGLRALSRGVRKWRGEKVIADLNWNRLADWRELIAQFFDCAVTRPLVHNIERVTIEVCRETRDECTSIQGLLLAGWLSSRLGWEATNAEAGQEIRIGLQRAGGKVDLRITPVELQSTSPGWVAAVEIEVSGPEGLTRLALRASDGEGHGTTTVTNPDGQMTGRSFALEDRSDVALLAEELEALGRERALDEALEAAGRFAEQLRS